MREDKDIFEFKEKKTRVRIYCEDIVFWESEGHYLLAHTKDGQIYRKRCTMAKLFTRVDEKVFKRTHRAFTVNLYYVQKTDKNKVYLSEPWEWVPLGRTYKKSFLKELEAFKKYDKDGMRDVCI